jgi:hypothetical protein
MTERSLGHNFLMGCLLSCCVPCYPTIVQRQAVAKKHGIESNCVEDMALTCCCGLCLIVQNANQMGEAADIRRAPGSLAACPACGAHHASAGAETRVRAHECERC